MAWDGEHVLREVLNPKTPDRFGRFFVEVGRCFVSKKYCQGFRLVNDDDNCDPKSLLSNYPTVDAPEIWQLPSKGR